LRRGIGQKGEIKGRREEKKQGKGKEVRERKETKQRGNGITRGEGRGAGMRMAGDEGGKEKARKGVGLGVGMGRVQKGNLPRLGWRRRRGCPGNCGESGEMFVLTAWPGYVLF
jgi:hypothetical protein